MMNSFNNPYANRKPKDLWDEFRRNNKVLLWLLVGSLLGLAIAEVSFFNIFYLVYLIYFGGILFRQFFNDEKLIKTFAFGGLSGIAIYLVAFSASFIPINLIPVFVGSSAMSLLAATATYAPNRIIKLAFFGNVKIKWLAIVLIGLDVLTINPSVPSIRITDLGGVIYGFLSIYLPARSTFSGNFNFGSLFRKRGPYVKKTKKRKPQTRSQTIEKDEEYNARKKKEQKEIDKILEKIKKSGYDSLSADEKRKLFDQSRK